MEVEFLIFFVVGFTAQLVDGALGMAYGVVASTFLLGFGVPPSVASACVHAAEVFTTGASASSHIHNRNVEWRMMIPLAMAGAVGGVAGAWLLVSIDGESIRPFITAYLAAMGLLILWKAWRYQAHKRLNPKWGPALGLVGGALDATGGGGWGPTVTSTLIGAGGAPRHVIGTVNCAEFFVAVAVSATFLTSLLTGHWREAGPLMEHAAAVGGLIVGGLLAAPLAGFIVRIAPPRVLLGMVGVLIMVLAGYQTWQLLR